MRREKREGKEMEVVREKTLEGGVWERRRGKKGGNVRKYRRVSDKGIGKDSDGAEKKRRKKIRGLVREKRGGGSRGRF